MKKPGRARGTTGSGGGADERLSFAPIPLGDKVEQVAVGKGTVTAGTTIGGFCEVGDGDTYQECNQDVPCAHPRFLFHATLLGKKNCVRYSIYIIHLN